MPDVMEIVRQWLVEHGYDGLFSDERCACTIDDFFHCTECPGRMVTTDFSVCEAGYRAPCDGTCEDGKCDFHIVSEKPKEV